MPDVIISAVQILASGDPSATVNHLRYGSENQRIKLLQGAWADIIDMFDDAERFRKKYSLQHLVVAPYQPMTRDHMMTVALPLIATKLNFPACDAVVVEHIKDRAGDPNAFPTHWHIVIEHFDPKTGRVRDWWKNRFKHELAGRILEGRLGHNFVLGFYHDAVIDALRADADADPTSDAGMIADGLEKAFPRGSRPDGSTVPQPLIRMHEAVGRDLVALRLACRKAWKNVADLDELNTALKPVGLYVQLSQDPPPKWMVCDADGVVGSVAGMMHAKNADVIGKLGDPKHDDWYRPHAVAGDKLERGPHGGAAGENLAGDRDADQPVSGLREVADQPERHDDAEAGRLFEAALNAAPPEILDCSEEIAQRIVMPFWQRAVEYFRRKAVSARDYVERRAVLDTPAIGFALAMVRQRREQLATKLWAAQERARIAFMGYRAATIPFPTAADAKAHNDRVEALRAISDKRQKQWKDLIGLLKEHDRRSEMFEAQHQKETDAHKANVVQERLLRANMYMRVAERCMALINDDRGAYVAWIAPETLFHVGVTAEIEAKPNARWKIAGPQDRAPDVKAIDETTGPRSP